MHSLQSYLVIGFSSVAAQFRKHRKVLPKTLGSLTCIGRTIFTVEKETNLAAKRIVATFFLESCILPSFLPGSSRFVESLPLAYSRRRMVCVGKTFICVMGFMQRLLMPSKVVTTQLKNLVFIPKGSLWVPTGNPRSIQQLFFSKRLSALALYLTSPCP